MTERARLCVRDFGLIAGFVVLGCTPHVEVEPADSADGRETETLAEELFGGNRAAAGSGSEALSLCAKYGRETERVFPRDVGIIADDGGYTGLGFWSVPAGSRSRVDSVASVCS